MKKLHDKSGITGAYEIITYRATFWTRLLARLPLPRSAWHHINKMRTPIRRSKPIENLIMDGTDTGVQLVAAGVAGLRNRVEVDKAAIGTGTTAPTDADTDLETPTTTDIDKTYQTQSANVITLEFFVSDISLADGTYNEFGVFILDTEDDYSTRHLFARSIISPAYSKASNEDTQINYQFTFNN